MLNSSEHVPHLATKLYLQYQSTKHQSLICIISNKQTNRLIKNFTLLNRKKTIIPILTKIQQQSSYGYQRDCLEYKYETIENLIISLFTISDGGGVNTQKYQELGCMQFQYQEIQGAKNCFMKGSGYFCIRREDIKDCVFFVQFVDDLLLDQRDRAMKAAYSKNTNNYGHVSHKIKGTIKYSKIAKDIYQILIKQAISTYLTERQRQRKQFLEAQSKKASQKMLSIKNIHHPEDGTTVKRLKSNNGTNSSKHLLTTFNSMRKLQLRASNNDQILEIGQRSILKFHMKRYQSMESDSIVQKNVDKNVLFQKIGVESMHNKGVRGNMKSTNHIKWKGQCIQEVRHESTPLQTLTQNKQPGQPQPQTQSNPHNNKDNDNDNIKQSKQTLRQSKRVSFENKKCGKNKKNKLHIKLDNIIKDQDHIRYSFQKDKQNRQIQQCMKYYFSSFQQFQRKKVNQLLVSYHDQFCSTSIPNYTKISHAKLNQTAIKSQKTSFHIRNPKLIQSNTTNITNRTNRMKRLNMTQKYTNKQKQQKQTRKTQKPFYNTPWIPMGIKLRKFPTVCQRVSNNVNSNTNDSYKIM